MKSASCGLLLLLLLAGNLNAKEIAGIELPDEVQLADSEQALNLNGAGIRKKFFISVYVAGKKSGDEKPQGGSIG